MAWPEPHDAVIVGDVILARVVGELLFRAGGMMLSKGLLEPLAAWAFRRGYFKLDQLSGGWLPDPPWARDLSVERERAADQESGGAS